MSCSTRRRAVEDGQEHACVNAFGVAQPVAEALEKAPWNALLGESVP
jgi:hypothetical protein